MRGRALSLFFPGISSYSCMDGTMAQVSSLKRHLPSEGPSGPGRSQQARCQMLLLSRGARWPQRVVQGTKLLLSTNLSLKPRVAALGEQPAYQGLVHCFATIVRTEGLAGLYRGASAMLLRDVPGYCLYFIPYVFLSDWITPEACAGPSPCAVWLAGGMAGAISWGTATPMDVVKSRLQADGVYVNKYRGVLDCISQSYQKEGLKVFFRGITVNAVRGFPMSAAMFLGYELSLQAIRGDHV
ncbi:SLC25A48, partial [Cervus elaphus hippelaphus]